MWKSNVVWKRDGEEVGCGREMERGSVEEWKCRSGPCARPPSSSMQRIDDSPRLKWKWDVDFKSVEVGVGCGSEMKRGSEKKSGSVEVRRTRGSVEE